MDDEQNLLSSQIRNSGAVQDRNFRTSLEVSSKSPTSQLFSTKLLSSLSFKTYNDPSQTMLNMKLKPIGLNRCNILVMFVA